MAAAAGTVVYALAMLLAFQTRGTGANIGAGFMVIISWILGSVAAVLFILAFTVKDQKIGASFVLGFATGLLFGSIAFGLSIGIVSGIIIGVAASVRQAFIGGRSRGKING